MIPSLLVVGAGPLQLPAIHEARALGFAASRWMEILLPSASLCVMCPM